MSPYEPPLLINASWEKQNRKSSIMKKKQDVLPYYPGLRSYLVSYHKITQIKQFGNIGEHIP